MNQPFDFSEYTPPSTLERVPEPCNEIWAFLLSFLVPGLGQMYNENSSACKENFDDIVSSVVLPSPPPTFPALFY